MKLESDPLIVYFSSVSENTKRFVDKLPFSSVRLPLLSSEVEKISVDHPYILVTPSYGAGHQGNAVPKQIGRFFRKPEHRNLCVGIIGGGNRNFGEYYQYAARFLASALGVPMLYGFEISGTKRDAEEVSSLLDSEWVNLIQEKNKRCS